MSINLTRDSLGRIKSNNTAITLKGGHYWIFKDDDRPGRCLVKPEEKLPFKVEYTGVPPCQTDDSFAVEERMWDPEPWDMLFNHMQMFSGNFLRLWLTGGTQVSGSGKEAKPLDLTPFNRVKVNNKWRWQVFKAVFTANGWNAEYFRRLSSFAEKAEARGIVLQITFFNYLDISSRFDGCGFRAWSKSPYNPELSDHPANLPNWAKNHLVNPANINDERQRQEFFLAPTNNLRKVQLALITKVVQTLSERTNIIYEVMNEPRGSNDQISKFNSQIIDAILAAASPKRPLVSVNASNMAADGGCDVDYWRTNKATIKNYDKIDAISYHGLTGYPASTPQNCNPNGVTVGVPAVDRKSVNDRFDRHRNPVNGHPATSLIYCTDAARSGIHIYSSTTDFEHELQVRDGQIYTGYPDNSTGTPADQRLKSDLENWASWCFAKALPNPGMAHFQNHSMNQRSYRRIRDATIRAEAAIDPSQAKAAASPVKPAQAKALEPELVD